MVQTAESRQGLNLASSPGTHFCWPTCWRILPEPEMGPVRMVVANVFAHESLEMPFVEDDHVFQQISSATSNPTLSDTVLPRTAKGSAGWLTPHVPHNRNHIDSKF